MKRFSIFQLLLLLLILVIGLFIGRYWGQSTNESPDTSQETTAKASTWTCSMHPQVRKDEPGDCPICGMDLIPADDNDEESLLDPDAIRMSETALRLADVQTASVQKRQLQKKIYLTGKIQADERSLAIQASHIPGRIEALHINFEGERVRKGQHIATLYSPPLLTAQRELLEAKQIQESQPLLLEAAKAKLRNWKLSDAQIEDILARGEVKEQIPIYADVSGYVLKQRARLGDYIQEGQALYELADLSRVWVLFDIYESDLPWIKKGSSIEFTVPSLPEKSFEGKIQYIDPIINPQERVAKARITLANYKGLLKPQMLVRGEAQVYINQRKASLAVPESAVLWTGKRSVVYVRDSSSNSMAFRLRNISLGPKLGDFYVVEKGLKEGEEIAINGAFSIDAAAQLADKSSMMRAEQAVDSLSEKEMQQLESLSERYLGWKNALVADEENKAYQKALSLQKALSKLKAKALQAPKKAMEKALKHLHHHKSLEKQRELFLKISEEMRQLAQQYKPLNQKIYLQYCPMANNDKGGYWLSLDEKIRNPYFGASMLSCGEVKKIIQ